MQGAELRQEASKGPLGHRVEQPPMNLVNHDERMCNLLIKV